MWRPRRAASLLVVALLEQGARTGRSQHRRLPFGGSARGPCRGPPKPPSPVLVHWMVGFSRPVAEQDTVTSLLNSMHCSGWGGGVNFSFSARDRGAPLRHHGVGGTPEPLLNGERAPC